MDDGHLQAPLYHKIKKNAPKPKLPDFKDFKHCIVKLGIRV